MPAVATALTIAAAAVAGPGGSPLAVPAQTATVHERHAAVAVRCLAASAAGCHGTLELRVLATPAPVLARGRVDLRTGERGTVRLIVRPAARRSAEEARAATIGAPAVARFRPDGAAAAITAGAVGLR